MWKFASVVVLLCACAFASFPEHEAKDEVKELDKDMSRFMKLVEEMLMLYEKVSGIHTPIVEKSGMPMVLPTETLGTVPDGKGLLSGLILNKPTAVVGNDGKYPLSVQLLISRNKVVTTPSTTTTAATTTPSTGTSSATTGATTGTTTVATTTPTTTTAATG